MKEVRKITVSSRAAYEFTSDMVTALELLIKNYKEKDRKRLFGKTNSSTLALSMEKAEIARTYLQQMKEEKHESYLAMSQGNTTDILVCEED